MTYNFRYDHLPDYAQTTARGFAELAATVRLFAQDKDSADFALHYLLIARDFALRSMLKGEDE